MAPTQCVTTSHLKPRIVAFVSCTFSAVNCFGEKRNDVSMFNYANFAHFKTIPATFSIRAREAASLMSHSYFQKGNAYLSMASSVCNADPIAADLRRLRRAAQPQQRSVRAAPSSHHGQDEKSPTHSLYCQQRSYVFSVRRFINTNCMISLDDLGRLSAFGLKDSCVARKSHKLGNREHLYSCFVRRKKAHDEIQAQSDKDLRRRGFQKTSCLSLF